MCVYQINKTQYQNFHIASKESWHKIAITSVTNESFFFLCLQKLHDLNKIQIDVSMGLVRFRMNKYCTRHAESFLSQKMLIFVHMVIKSI